MTLKGPKPSGIYMKPQDQTVKPKGTRQPRGYEGDAKEQKGQVDHASDRRDGGSTERKKCWRKWVSFCSAQKGCFFFFF